MEIVKRLVLNKNPKDVPYGGIVCAKNMMVDDTGSYLTNDIGFKQAFKCKHEGERIVGVIACTEELVIFTYQDSNNTSRIYRKKDIDSGKLVQNINWSYNGGKITGTFTYNYKKELIIVVSEYVEDGNLRVPLKSINLDKPGDGRTYALEEEIPPYTCSKSITNTGNLVCGVYTFFIRFKLNEFDSTKWFQVTGDINIIQTASSKKYIHRYLQYDNSTQHNNLIETHANEFTVNANKVSNKSVNLSFMFNGHGFNVIELGYIVKRNSEVKGRLQGEYKLQYNSTFNISTLNITVSDNTFLEEVSVDSMLENPHQFFNVKNIINYNNRVYISNYQEYETDSYNTIAKTTEVSISDVQREVEQTRNVRSVSGNKIYTLNLKLFEFVYKNQSDGIRKQSCIINYSNILADSKGYITNKEEFINSIVDKLQLYGDDFNYEGIWGSGNLNYYWFIQLPESNTNADSICIASKINNNDYQTPPNWGWNFTIPDYRIKITGTNKDNATILIEYNNKSWDLLTSIYPSKGTSKSCVLAFLKADDNFYYYGNGRPIYNYPNTEGCIPGGVTEMPYDIQLTVDSFTVNNSEDVEPSEHDSDPISGGGISNNPISPNNRTLIPYQKYNFFIHYVRKDGSFTLGFPIAFAPQTYTLATGNNIIIPKFKAQNPNDNEFVGYFITYEDVESTVDCVYITKGTNLSNNDLSLIVTNSSYLYDMDVIRGTSISYQGVEYNISNDALKYIENKLTYNHLEINNINANIGNGIAFILKSIANIYNSKVKTLYRLTGNIYTFGEYIEDDDYLPGYYNNQTIIEYVDRIDSGRPNGFIIDPAASVVFGFNSASSLDTGKETTYDVTIHIEPMYSNVPFTAMNIKQDYDQSAITLTHWNFNDNVTKTYINSLVNPSKLHDLLELQACYTAKPSKSYTNYNKNNEYIFDRTIYRSDVFSDESLENNFRHFEINNYKNIFENKGKIINIIGIGLYFIVHTEYSIFVFDRTPKLTARTQLDIPDVFDIDYQDLMPSNEGFGGLANKDESIITKNGYIWYDRVNKYIFSYENGKVTILSVDINNFLKYINVVSVRFAEDIINSRLIICVLTGNNKYVTLSYNFTTKTFISLHDYKFTHCFKTYNKSYIFDENSSEKNTLYEFDNNAIVNYKDLRYIDDFYVPTYKTYDLSYISGVKSYIDIMFNKDYFNVKTLESIRYILSEILSRNNNVIVTEEYLDKTYSGDQLRVYTDETNSGDLNIKVDGTKINKENDYKLPYYDRGYWNLNYFRNKISTPITVEELTSYATEQGIEPQRLIDANTYSIPNGPSRLIESDNRSLIYGKYIVVRFIFDRDRKIKLEAVDIKTNIY